MAILGRSYPSDTAVIVKAPDLCNWMGTLLLQHDSRTRIVFLFCSLKVFLLQVLKVAHRREWLREHMQALKGALSQVPFLSGMAVNELSDAQCAAAMWLLNSFLCATVLASQEASGRVLVLDGDKLLSQPRESVRTVARFFSLTQDEANRTALAEFQPSNRYAKDPSLNYDSDMRARELDHALSQWGDQVQAAVTWAKEIAPDWIPICPFPIGD